MIRLFRRRKPPTLRVVIDNKPAVDLAAIVCANEVFEMTALHPHLKTAQKPVGEPSFLVGRKGMLFRVTVEAIR